jgi:predicted dehydrogenase
MKKLNWGMIGGGNGSQIGPAHRLAAGLDGHFSFVAGALDHDPAAGRAFAQSLGIAADRAYGDWREMLEGERNRADKIDLVTVATPNATHYEISKAFLQAGITVLCEKPMTVTEGEAEDLVLAPQSFNPGDCFRMVVPLDAPFRDASVDVADVRWQQLLVPEFFG